MIVDLPRWQDTAWPQDRERDVRKHLLRRLDILGGAIRKLQYVGRRSAPDELVLLPRHHRHFLAELKRPGEKPRPDQQREIELLLASGVTVYVLDSREAVDAALFWDLV